MVPISVILTITFYPVLSHVRCLDIENKKQSYYIRISSAAKQFPQREKASKCAIDGTTNGAYYLEHRLAVALVGSWQGHLKVHKTILAGFRVDKLDIELLRPVV